MGVFVRVPKVRHTLSPKWGQVILDSICYYLTCMAETEHKVQCGQLYGIIRLLIKIIVQNDLIS